MKKVYKALFLATVFSSSLFAQKRAAYFLFYEDFVKGLTAEIVELKHHSHYRADYEDNKLLTLTKIDSNKIVLEKKVFIYGQLGSLKKTVSYDGSGNLLSEISYEPDEVQKKLIEKIYGREWIPHQEGYYTETVFDSTGNVINSNIFSVNGELIGRVESKYGEENRLIKETWFIGKHDQLLEYTIFSFDSVDSIQTVEQFDGKGDIISSIKLKIHPQ
ncbi:MAG: hypothetical protein ISS81_05990 [Candidatus Marinimicrobia bacterium]|nr:hypothetical protein [Candidatus Neomarinimicrobiota bacterium]